MAQLPTAAGGPSVVNAAIASGERRETELAFQYLDQVIARRDPCLVYLAVDPQWDASSYSGQITRCFESFGAKRG
jgi:hypothetical protein